MATSSDTSFLLAEQLQDKSILVTGGSSGLGLATVRHAALSGAYVTIADVIDAGEIVQELTALGQQVQYVKCDVSKWEEQQETFRSAVNLSPPKELDIVVMFAAVDDSPNLVDLIKASGSAEPQKPSIRCLDINLQGMIYTSILALHHLRPKGSSMNKSATIVDKSLVFISSLAAYIDDTHNSVYTASKFGTRGLFRSIKARANDELGIRVNLIAPWAIRTPMTAPLLEMMEQMGIREGHGITFATEETMTEAVSQCMTHRTVTGRAFAVVPEGFFDIGDDIDGAYGGLELQRLMGLRKTAGDFLYSYSDTATN